MSQPGSQSDTRLAARLVVEGLLDQATGKAVVVKAQELRDRGRPLSVAEICIRKGWISGSEARWLEDMDAPPQDLLPGLELHRQIGRGGMSRVYGGRDVASGQPVAVKVLLPALRRREKPLREFRVEGELLVSLEHENIVTGYYVHEHDGLVYVVMELVHGRSVQEFLDNDGPFQEDAALYIILQTARALTCLHERGLVHRDVKPGNILIDRENTVKLCDLGLAVGRGTESEVDGAGSTAGTAHYIAPEQALGEADLDVRSDIYALGVTLFQLTVGKLPFEGETSRETMAHRLLDELHSPELRHISPHLSYFIRKMMARDREVRYQSPHELIQDIEEQIRGRKTLTAQPGKGSTELTKPFKEVPSVTRRGPGRRTPRPAPRRRR